MTFAPVRLSGKVRERVLRLIRSLPLAHPCGLRLCRSTPVDFIPAGNHLWKWDGRRKSQCLTTEVLRGKENFACVRIFYLGSGRKTSDIDVTFI